MSIENEVRAELEQVLAQIRLKAESEPDAFKGVRPNAGGFSLLTTTMLEIAKFSLKYATDYSERLNHERKVDFITRLNALNDVINSLQERIYQLENRGR